MTEKAPWFAMELFFAATRALSMSARDGSDRGLRGFSLDNPPGIVNVLFW